jgi:hypothetical protein
MCRSNQSCNPARLRASAPTSVLTTRLRSNRCVRLAALINSSCSHSSLSMWLVIFGSTPFFGSDASLENELRPRVVGLAVVDALAERGVTHLEMPVTPEQIWRAARRGGCQELRAVLHTQSD